MTFCLMFRKWQTIEALELWFIQCIGDEKVEVVDFGIRKKTRQRHDF